MLFGAGNAFANLHLRGRYRLFRLLIAALVIPAQVAMSPLFLLCKELGLVNSFAGVLAPNLATIFGIFLVRQYALSIPDEMLEAARVDGADEWRIFVRIVLPGLSPIRSEEHTSELQSLMRISYAVFCLKKKNNTTHCN